MITDKARKLILDQEGLGQPSEWPRGESGITIGYGYDLGYVTESEFVNDWKDTLPAEYIDRLKTAIGKTGIEARNIAYKFKDIWIDGAGACV
jgi:hypothetical protein